MAYNKDKTSFRDIVLGHLKNILGLATQEFTSGDKITPGGVRVKVPNPKIAYCQAVDALNDVLLPFFDKEMNEMFREIDEAEDKERNDSPTKTLGINQKYIFSRRLFQQLNLLLHRNGYLKSEVYSEGELEEAQEDGE